MKKVILLLVCLLLVPMAFAECRNVEFTPQYKDNTESCENLVGFRLEDPDCSSSGRRGPNCWGDLSSVRLVKPSRIVFEDSGTQNYLELESSIIQYDWNPVRCVRPGKYEVRLEFDNGCSEELELDFSRRDSNKGRERARYIHMRNIFRRYLRHIR